MTEITVTELIQVIKTLAARVEALEQRQGSELSTFSVLKRQDRRINELERTVDDLVNVAEPPKGLFPPSASGGPKREAEPDRLIRQKCSKCGKETAQWVEPDWNRGTGILCSYCWADADKQPAPPDAGTQETEKICQNHPEHP